MEAVLRPHSVFTARAASPCRMQARALTARCLLRAAHHSRRFARRVAASQNEDAQVAELLKQADALMTQLGSHEAHTDAPVSPDGEEPEGQARQRLMRLVCDESSCVIVPAVADDSTYGPQGSFIGTSGQAAAHGNGPRDFLLSEGEGWKLGFDRDPVSSAAYTALIASDTWSVSLTKQEFIDFVQLLRKLQRSIATLQVCGEWGSDIGGRRGAPPVESSLELQTERVWVQARAPQKQLFDLTKVFRKGVKKRGREQQAAFHLRFIINSPAAQPQREFEGRFSAEVVMRLLEHLETYPPALEALEEPAQEGSARDSMVAGYIG